MVLNCDRVPIMLLVFSNQSPKEMNMSSAIGGPFLQTAVFCEKVLQEKDGVVSAIRIIDRFTISPPGGAPELMPPMNVGMVALIIFKSGDASGKFELKITPTSPSGKELATFTFPLTLAGGERSANIVINYTLKAEEAGLYWFDIILGNKPYTKMSMNLIYERTPAISTTSSSVH
jgi:hypothetical protein